jgi:CBS domain-containing protein
MPSVRDLMTVEVPFTTLNTPVTDAARLMRASNKDSLIVYDLGRPAGIVTERDFLRKVTAEGKNPLQVHVGDVVSSPLVTIAPSESAKTAAALMIEKGIRHLPVVRDGVLIGMLTLEDFAKHMSKKKRIRSEILESMDDGAEHELEIMQLM